MKNIWIDKPKPWAVGHYHPVLELCYDKRDMDAWLEKLKAYYKPIEKKAEKYDAVNWDDIKARAYAEQKLEVIALEIFSWCENCMEPCGDCMLGKIKRIVEDKE